MIDEGNWGQRRGKENGRRISTPRYRDKWPKCSKVVDSIVKKTRVTPKKNSVSYKLVFICHYDWLSPFLLIPAGVSLGTEGRAAVP